MAPRAILALLSLLGAGDHGALEGAKGSWRSCWSRTIEPQSRTPHDMIAFGGSYRVEQAHRGVGRRKLPQRRQGRVRLGASADPARSPASLLQIADHALQEAQQQRLL